MDHDRFESTRVDDLAPTRANASERSAWIRIGGSFAVVVTLVLMAAIAPSGSRLRFDSERAPIPDAMPLPPVAAPPDEPVDSALPAPLVAAIDHAVEVGELPTSEIEALVGVEDPAAESRAPIDAYDVVLTPSDTVDRVISPSLGDPAEMRIERSRRDREREDRAAARAAIAESLDAARRARKEGRLEEADAGYAAIALLAPDDWSALIERSSLLVELERPGDALALVEGARGRAPRNQALLITHARLLEAKGDRAGAIGLLERSGLALTEAPDVHALIAAYHQRSGAHEAAIERYEEILRRFPEESRGWMGLGISLEAVGRRNEARDVYRISLQVGELPGTSRRWVTSRLASLGEED